MDLSIKKFNNKLSAYNVLGAMFILLGALLINLMFFAPDFDVDGWNSQNKVELQFGVNNIKNCEVTNYIFAKTGGNVIVNCPVDGNSFAGDDIYLYINGLSMPYQCFDESVELDGVHVVQCSVPPLTDASVYNL